MVPSGSSGPSDRATRPVWPESPATSASASEQGGTQDLNEARSLLWSDRASSTNAQYRKPRGRSTGERADFWIYRPALSSDQGAGRAAGIREAVRLPMTGYPLGFTGCT